MANWDSADLLARCYVEAKRPATDASTSDAEWYQRLSAAQDQWLAIFAAHVPHTQIAAPEQLATSDNKVYTMAAYPLGHVEFRDGRTGPLLSLGPEFSETADLVLEGQSVRIPGNRTRVFASGLWARYVPTGTVISASVEPVLKPAYARVLLVLQAVADWAREGGLRDPSPFLQKLQHRAWGDPMNPGDVGLLGALKSQAYGQGTVAENLDGYWWRQWAQ